MQFVQGAATELAWAADGYRPDLPFDLPGNGPKRYPDKDRRQVLLDLIEAWLKRLYDAIESGVADLDDSALRDRIAFEHGRGALRVGLRLIADRFEAGGPGRKIMLQRSAEAGPRLGRDVKIVRQDAQAEAWMGHPGNIAPPGFHMNDRSLSRDILLVPGKTVTKGALSLISNLDRLASPRRASDSRSRLQPRSGGGTRQT